MRGTGCEALDASHHPTCWETRCELQLIDPHAEHTLPGNTDRGTGCEDLNTPCEGSQIETVDPPCEALDANHHPTCWEARCELLADPHTGHTLPGNYKSRHWMRGSGHTMQGIPDPDTGQTMRCTGCQALDASHPTCCQYHTHLSVSLMPCTVFFFRLHASKQQSESDVVSRIEVMECYVAVDMEY